MVVFFLFLLISPILLSLRFSNPYLRAILLVWSSLSFLYQLSPLYLASQSSSIYPAQYLIYSFFSSVFILLGALLPLNFFSYFTFNLKRIQFPSISLIYHSVGLFAAFFLFVILVLRSKYIFLLSLNDNLRFGATQLDFSIGPLGFVLITTVSSFLLTYCDQDTSLKSILPNATLFRRHRYNIKLSSFLFSIFLLLVLASLLLLLARGDRNSLLFLLLPFLLRFFNVILINPYKILLAMNVTAFGSLLLERYRSLALLQIIENPSLAFQFINISEGEFAMQYQNLERILPLSENVNTFGSNFIPYKSILVDPIVNLLNPLFSFDFLSLAAEYSSIYGEGYGLGFSHQLESALNFSWFAMLLYYLPLGIFFRTLSGFAVSNKFFLRYSYFLFFPILFNLFRIDLSVCVKLYVYSLIPLFFVLWIRHFKVT